MDKNFKKKAVCVAVSGLMAVSGVPAQMLAAASDTSATAVSSSQIIYTVEYDPNGGSGTMADTIVTYGVLTPLRANTFIKTGYTFSGWNVSRADGRWFYTNGTKSAWYAKGQQPEGYYLNTYKANSSVSKMTSINGDVITMHAKWMVNKYTVKYDPNGGSGTMADTMVTYGVVTPLRKNTFIKTGYTFSGWNVSRADGRWFYTNGTKSAWYAKGQQPEGYYLNTYKANSSVSKMTSINGDVITMHAKWTVNKYTVKYDPNGGSGTMADTIVTYGVVTPLRKNTFIKTGYTFSGWNVSRADGRWFYTNGTKSAWYAKGQQPEGYYLNTYKANSSVSKMTSINGDVITMHAKWTVNKYTVKYDSNGGSGTMADTTVTYGVSTPLKTNTFQKTGYTFSGWNISRADGRWFYTNGTKSAWYAKGQQPEGYYLNTYKANSSVSKMTSINGDVITMHAKWTADTYTIEFDSNGLTGTMEPVVCQAGKTVTLPENAFENGGQIFAGWSVSRASDGKLLYKSADGAYEWYTEGEAPEGCVIIVFDGSDELCFDDLSDGETLVLTSTWAEAGYNGFLRINKSVYYYKNGAAYTGKRQINNNYYYFNEETGRAYIGFHWFDGKLYCYDDEGRRYQNGFFDIDGSTYYFYSAGVCALGLKTINNVKYCFDEQTGALLTGFFTDHRDYRYYYNGRNGMVTGWKTIDGNKHYFYSDGTMARGVARINGQRFYFNWDTGAQEYGLIDLGYGHKAFFKEEGGILGGIQTINGVTYGFDENEGFSLSGMQTFDCKKYYFDEKTYEMCKGFVESEGKTYYFGSDGAMCTGFVNADGRDYYFNDAGILQKGFFWINGRIFYSDEATGALYTGFYEISEGMTCYFDGASGALSGLQNIGGDLYYFTSGGYMVYGAASVDNSKYFFDNDTGKAVYGFVSIGSNLYYYTKQGTLLYGLQEIDGKKYYFNQTYGNALTGWQTIDGARYYFSTDDFSAVSGKWDLGGYTYMFDENCRCIPDSFVEWEGRTYYCRSDGSVVKGFRTIDSKNYMFDENTGEAVSGLVYYDGEMYGFDGVNGNLSGLKYIDGKLYYFSAAGRMLTGLRSIDVDGVTKYYYFDRLTGEAQKGLIYVDGSSKPFCFGDDYSAQSGVFEAGGTLYYFKPWVGTGYVNIGDTSYYFDSNNFGQRCGFITLSSGAQAYFLPEGGKATSAQVKEITQLMSEAADGFNVIYGVTYYYQNKNALTGWQTIDGKTYYFAEDNGEMYTGLRFIDGKLYYFGSDGALQTGQIVIDGAARYFDDSGVMSRGICDGRLYSDTGEKAWGFALDSGLLYYFNSDGTTPLGSAQINGASYYFSENGSAATGLVEVNGDSYYFGKTGEMNHGFQTIDGVKMFFDDSGKKQTGFVTYGGNTLYFDQAKGLLTGMNTIGEKQYYFNSAGVMMSGVISVDGARYYFSPEDGSAQSGFVTVGGKTYYADPQTFSLATGLVSVGGSQYYFSPNSSAMLTGWVTDGDNEYYFSPATGKRVLGFADVGKNTYYLGENGRLTGWQQIDGENYYFGTSGNLYKGLQTIDDVRYYFNESSGKRENGFVTIGKYSYYVLESGGFATGAITLDDGREFFANSIGRIQLGFSSREDGVLRYYDAKKGMLKSTEVTVDGIEYVIDENGAAAVKNVSTDAEKIIDAGIKCLGTPYDHDPAVGMDCSYFSLTVMSAVGIDLYNASCVQYAMLKDDGRYEKITDLSKLQVGDLIYYVSLTCENGEGCRQLAEIHHVAVYMGGGKVMEAVTFEGPDENGKYVGYVMVRDLSDLDNPYIALAVRVI